MINEELTIKDIHYIFKDDNSVIEFLKKRLEEIQDEYINAYNTKMLKDKIYHDVRQLMNEVRDKYNYQIMPDHLKVVEKDGIITIDMAECFTNIYMYETYKQLMEENNALRAKVAELENQVQDTAYDCEDCEEMRDE